MPHRNAVSVLPDPVGARMRVWAPEEMAGQPCTWAAVGSGNVDANHSRTAGEKRSSATPERLPRGCHRVPMRAASVTPRGGTSTGSPVGQRLTIGPMSATGRQRARASRAACRRLPALSSTRPASCRSASGFGRETPTDHESPCRRLASARRARVAACRRQPLGLQLGRGCPRQGRQASAHRAPMPPPRPRLSARHEVDHRAVACHERPSPPPSPTRRAGTATRPWRAASSLAGAPR